MATEESSTDDRSVYIESLPLVDLSLLSQPELYSLSLSSSSSSSSSSAPRLQTNDSVIPKIDRSVFNESAGSRKQTFCRLRLAPRNKQICPPVTASASAFHIPLHIPEPVDEENSQIIALLQQLFGVESLRNAKRGNDDCLVPVQVEFKQPSPESAALAFQNIPIDVVDCGPRKRKRGRPRKNENLGIPVEEEPRKVDGDVYGEAVTMVNEKGFLVDAVALANVEDPFGEELKRRTQGLETESQLLEFLETLNGEWGSQRKKRRIVEASGLADLLPRGWKIVLSLKRRAGRASIVCRRYVSPEGHQFVSCKEVSAYLLSFFRVQGISHLKSSYTDGSLQFSSNINMASESGVGHVPTGATKTDVNASCLHLACTSVRSHHEKQATISSSIGSEKLNTSDVNFISDFDLQTEVKQPLKADKNDANSVQGCSLEEDRVRNICNEKLVDAIEASDAACNLYIPLVFTNPFSNNNSGICQFSDEINANICIKSGISNFASQDRNTGCYETVPCGYEQAHVDNNGHGLSVRLVEDHRQKIGFESSMLAPNSKGKIFAGSNLEDRHFISSLEDMEISYGKPVKDDNRRIISSRDQSEIEDVSINVKLQSSSEGCSLVPSQNELKHSSINSTGRIQTSMLKDSAEGKCFDSDLPIDERTCLPSGYINNVSFSSCTKGASDSGGVYIAPNLKVADEVSAQERSSLNGQNCEMDNLLLRSSESNLLTPTSNEHPSAFDDNVTNISVGTFDALEAVDAGCKKPQVGIVSCSNDVVVDAYTTASIMQGRSQGCVSVPLGGSILNQFDKQNDDGVNNANKSCLSEKAKTEQVEILQTDSMGMPEFR